MQALLLLLAERDMEIVRLRDQLRVEQSEKAELQQQLEQFASSQAQVPTSISFFAPPPDMKLLQQLDTIKKTIAGLKESWSAQERSGIDEIVKELPLLRVSSAPLPTTSPTEGHMTHCFNPITTKVIHLTSPPPLPPQVAQFYSSSKSNDTAIEELQEQLNDSRKEAKRTAEVATRKCKEFRSLCCKLFGWRVDVLDSEKKNTKRCRVHSLFNEEDYLQIEFKRRDCHLVPSRFLETLEGEVVSGLMNEGGIPRLLQQLYQLLHSQHHSEDQ